MQETIVRAFYDLRTPLWDAVFTVLTTLGEQAVVIAVSALIYWNIRKRGGYIIIMAYIASMVVNDILKISFQTARPFQELVGVTALRVETAEGFAFPSGHTQGATTLFVALALVFRRNVLYLLTAAAATLVGVSRVYLGVHWPIDVVASWVLGSLLAFLVYRGLVRWRHYGPLDAILIVGIAVLAVITGSVVGIAATLAPAIQASSMGELGGVGIGLLAGFAVERRYVGFSTTGRFSVKLLRYLLGLVGTAVLLVLPGMLEPTVYVGDFLIDVVRYGLAGFWAVGLFPLIGRRTGLFSVEGDSSGEDEGAASTQRGGTGPSTPERDA
jgi:undecaprenyl-diphosphatase